jgi:hypothetical protein
MRYLICAAFALTLVACGRRDNARTPSDATVDTVGPADSSRMAGDTARNQTMSAIPDRLLGSWTAKGYDAGSSRAQPFTLTWTRSPDGSLAGKVVFQGGEQYNVKMVSTGDSTFVYQSDPHRSPTLGAQVVTRTQARLVGDTLSGSYSAKAKNGKVLKGTFKATRGS